MKKLINILTVTLIGAVVALSPSAAFSMSGYSCGTYGAGNFQENNCESDTIDVNDGPLNNLIDILPGTGASTYAFIFASLLTITGAGTLLYLFKNRSRQ